MLNTSPISSRSSQTVSIFSPVSHISCSTDLNSISVPPQQYTYIDLSKATLGYNTLWILPFLDHFEDLSELNSNIFLCFLQRLAWSKSANVELYYNEHMVIDKISLADRSFEKACKHHEEMSNDILFLKNNFLFDEKGDYYNYHQSFKTKLIKFVSKIFLSMDPSLIKQWFDEIMYISYDLLSTDMVEGVFDKKEERRDCMKVEYHSNNMVYLLLDGSITMNAPANLNLITKTHKQVCADFKMPTSFKKPWMQKNDVTLIIVFNNPHYEVIPFLELMYRSTYPSIIYCGPVLVDYDVFKELLEYKLSFVVYQKQNESEAKGALNYQCLMNVIKMNLHTQGYLVVADDLVLLSRKIEFFDYNQPWFIPEEDIKICDLSTMKECTLHLCEFNTRWKWWEDYRAQSLNVLEDIETLAADSVLFRACSSAIKKFTGGKKRIFGSYSDIYYLPKKLSGDFYELAQVFLKHGVFVEIAVPTIFRCLDYRGHSSAPLIGLVEWKGSDRDIPWKHFKSANLVDKHYFHPLKLSRISEVPNKYTVSQDYTNLIKDNMSEIEKKERLREFFCTIIVPCLNEPEYFIPD